MILFFFLGGGGERAGVNIFTDIHIVTSMIWLVKWNIGYQISTILKLLYSSTHV